MSKAKLSVYYDGLCQLCSREIDHYRKARGAEQLRFIDITAVDFQAEKEGLDPQRVHRVMHVKSAEGQIYTEVEAFVQIWKVLPGYSWMARAVESPLIRPIANLGYQGFARVRPWLPKKKADCSASPYCETGAQQASAGSVGASEPLSSSAGPVAAGQSQSASVDSPADTELQTEAPISHFAAKSR